MVFCGLVLLEFDSADMITECIPIVLLFLHVTHHLHPMSETIHRIEAA